MRDLKLYVLEKEFTKEEAEEILKGEDLREALEYATEDDDIVLRMRSLIRDIEDSISIEIGKNRISYGYGLYRIYFEFDAEKKDILKNKFNAKWDGSHWKVKELNAELINFLENS